MIVLQRGLELGVGDMLLALATYNRMTYMGQSRVLNISRIDLYIYLNILWNVTECLNNGMSMAKSLNQSSEVLQSNRSPPTHQAS